MAGGISMKKLGTKLQVKQIKNDTTITFIFFLFSYISLFKFNQMALLCYIVLYCMWNMNICAKYARYTCFV